MKSSNNILVVFALSRLSYQQTYLSECEFFLGNGRLVNGERTRKNAFDGSGIMFRNNLCVMHGEVVFSN